MPWSDLSQVTAALTNLLDLNIRLVLAVPPPNVTITAAPPDQLGTNVQNTVSLYLHHVRETIYTQNLPGPGSDRPNIATAPLGLDLYYVLTAHHRTNTTFDATIEQRLIGFAMKTLHDFPVVTDDTTILANPVITGTARGRGNRLNVELRKLEPDQAFAIWTTGDRQFARLAAYYQVGPVLLEPERPRRMPGVVLSVGAFVTPFNDVVLTGSRSALAFALPPSAGGGAQTLRAEPARPAVLAAAGPDSTFTLLGENLAAGIRRRLLLRNARWQRLTPPADRVPVDPALNVANGWTVAVRPDRVEVRVGSQLTFVPPGGGPPRTIDVFPGSYTAQLEAVLEDRVVAGEARTHVAVSNETAFGIAPRITTHQLQAGGTRVVVRISAAFPLNVQPPAGERLDIRVSLDGVVYTRRIAAGQPAPGEFTVQAASVTLGAITPIVAGEHPVRLLVEGVDAQPYWVTP